MNIKKFLGRLKTMLARLEAGNALAEYMPTIAGAMVVTTVALVQVGGGAKQSFCKVTDAFGEPPSSCTADADKPGGGTDGSGEEGGGEGENPGDHDEPNDPECVITISSAEGTDPAEWNTEWDGEPDILFVEVAALPEPVDWSLKLRFPTDPDGSEDVEIGSGVIEEDGTYEITVNYPPAEEWPGPSDDGYGTYESHATLHITDPCGDVGWDRWFKSAWVADLGIEVEHDVSPVTSDGETLNYDITVTNHGPTNAEVYEGQGVVVNVPMPSGVWVENISASQGVCETQCDWGETAGALDGAGVEMVACPKEVIVCDLGALNYTAMATISVETTVADVATCDLYAEGDVSAPRPPDPNPDNDWDDTLPTCEVACEMNVTDLVLIDAKSDTVISSITDGMEITMGDGDEININAEVAGSIGSVEFYVNGEYESTENVAPYAIAGDSSGNFKTWNVSPGSYTVQAIPYGGHGGSGETCSERTVSFTIVEEDVPDEDDDGGEIYDPDQPTGDPEATCPTGYESLVSYDHFATAGDPKPALKWGNASRQSHTYEFELGGDWDTVLVTRGAVGHPEEGCPEADHTYCGWPNQDNEHWAIDINGEQVALYLDNGALDHVYLIYPNVELGVMPAGTHELRMYHAGLLDQPSNSSGPSVGAFVRVCVDKGDDPPEDDGGSDAVCIDDNPLGVATEFNTFTLGDHNSPWGSDTEGRMAVGGDATIGSYSVGYELDSSWSGKDVLVVGEDLNFTSGRVYYGNAVVGGTANVNQSGTIDGDLLSGSPIDFGAAEANLKALSSVFGDAQVNGTTTKKWSCAIVLDGTDEQLNVFEVNGSDLASMCQLEINIPTGSTALVNITGTNVTFPGAGFFLNGQSTPSSHGSAVIDDIAKVIYNLPDATSVTIPWGGISGAMLAPKAHVSFNSGVIWGTMISGSFEGQGQINHVPFEGCVPAMTY